jgi:hypothetical protein
MLICAASAAAFAQTVCTLSAELTMPEGTALGAQIAVSARLDCAAGTIPEVEDRYSEGPHDRLDFPAVPGERLIIGASLTDEAFGAPDNVGEVKPDLDFPIRFVVIPGQGGNEEWQFTTGADPALGYGHLIMRVWNTAALAECSSGRDGCEKFGYILLWDELRTEGALELPLAPQ